MSVRSLLELLLALTVASGYDGFPYQQGPAPHGLTRTYWSNLRVSTRDYSRKRQDNVHGRFYPSPSGHSAPWDVDMTPPLNHLSMSLAWGLGSTSGAGPTYHTPMGNGLTHPTRQQADAGKLSSAPSAPLGHTAARRETGVKLRASGHTCTCKYKLSLKFSCRSCSVQPSADQAPLRSPIMITRFAPKIFCLWPGALPIMATFVRTCILCRQNEWDLWCVGIYFEAGPRFRWT